MKGGNMSTFSEILKRERKNKGYSKAELARKLNIPYTTYQNYENGREPKIDVIKQISEELEINPSVFFDLEKSALENVGTYAKQIELSASVEIHHADSSRGTIELLPSLPTSSFIHIDPYEIDKKGGSGVTYLDVLIQATLLGMKCLLWYGFMTGDDKASLDNYITSSLEKAGIKDYTGVELTMNSIRKDSVLCNPGILGSGILATNVSQTSKDIILDYSNQLVDIYKDAKYKDYDGSLYIQHL